MKYFDVFMAQAKVAWEAGVNFGRETDVGLIQGEFCEKDGSISDAPAYCNPLIKLVPTMDLKDLLEVVNYNSFCQTLYDQRTANVHKQQLAHLFWRKPA